MQHTTAPDLVLHMLLHRHNALSNALYASPHGGPIRTLPLILESGTKYYELHIPCLALYDQASNPTLLTKDMTRQEWNTLLAFVQEEGVLKVILSPDRGRTDFLGKLTLAGEDEPDQGSVGVRFWWQEGPGGVASIKKGLAWVKGRMSS